MKLRLIRRRGAPEFWHLQRKVLFGWEYIDTYPSLSRALAGAEAALQGQHPSDIIQIIDVSTPSAIRAAAQAGKVS